MITWEPNPKPPKPPNPIPKNNPPNPERDNRIKEKERVDSEDPKKG